MTFFSDERRIVISQVLISNSEQFRYEIKDLGFSTLDLSEFEVETVDMALKCMWTGEAGLELKSGINLKDLLKFIYVFKVEWLLPKVKSAIIDIITVLDTEVCPVNNLISIVEASLTMFVIFVHVVV